MSNLFDYNITPGSNNAAAPTGAPENMLPSSVNDTMRQMMANSAAAFTCYTAGGSANSQTVTMSPTLAAYSNKVRIAFIPVATNTGACTLNVNSLGAVDIKMLDGTDPPAGALNGSGVSIVQHNGTNFRLLNPANNIIIYEADLALGGDFGVQTAHIVAAKSGAGKIVSLFVNASLTHSSKSAPASGAVIPAAYRPASNVITYYEVDSATEVKRLVVDINGILTFTYRDWAGSLLADTTIGVFGFSISWYVAG